MRFRFRFSIRDLFWLVLVAALCAGWWASLKRVEENRSKAFAILSFMTIHGHELTPEMVDDDYNQLRALGKIK
jgi:hypothetical protein